MALVRRRAECRKASYLLQQIIEGAAGSDAHMQFAAHLSTCRSCAARLGPAEVALRKLQTTLPETAQRLPSLPQPPLPERPPQKVRPIRTLVADFSLLVVLGLGLFLLLAAVGLSWKALRREAERIQRFEAVNRALSLTLHAQKLAAKGLSHQEIARRLAPRKEGMLLDPWGHPYVLGGTERKPIVYSAGPNGKAEQGGGDDITHLTAPPKLGRFRPRPANLQR